MVVMAALVYMFFCVVWLEHLSDATGSNFTLEFEHAVERENQNFRAMWRGEASKKKTLLLYEGDYVVLDFCLSSLTKVEITNLRYSNDGPSDNITMFIDGIPIGSFETFALSDWGRMWNVFQESGPVGSSVLIHPGNHELNISITMSDNYGVEFDSLQFTLDNEVSEEIFLCQTQLKEHVMFNDIYTPVAHDDNGQKTTLIQNSYKSSCIDETNVEICFNTSNWIGVQFYAASEYLNNTGVGDDWMKEMMAAKTCQGIEDGNIWKLGTFDNSNSEFGGVDSSYKNIKVSIPKVLENLKVIPGTILHPKETSFEITFNVKEGVRQLHPWLLFSLGLSEAETVTISLQYYDFRINATSTKDPKDFYFHNTKEVWHIPSEAFSPVKENRILITFEKTDFPISLDFIRLDTEERSKKDNLIQILENRFLKVLGEQESLNQDKMMLVTGSEVNKTVNVNKFSILARKGRRAAFAKILTMYSDGRIFMHTLAEKRLYWNIFPKVIDEVSGFQFRPRHGDRSDIFITQVDIDTSELVMNVTYTDGSKVMFKFSLIGDETKLVIFDILQVPSASNDIFGCYFSKAHSNVAAVDDITVDKSKKYYVIDPDLNNVTGDHFLFDHEFATWYVRVGADLAAVF